MTSSDIAISWTTPSDDGGCRLYGYAIYVDDGDEVFVEYDTVNVRNKPFLTSYTINMASLSKVAGQTYSI